MTNDYYKIRLEALTWVVIDRIENDGSVGESGLLAVSNDEYARIIDYDTYAKNFDNDSTSAIFNAIQDYQIKEFLTKI